MSRNNPNFCTSDIKTHISASSFSKQCWSKAVVYLAHLENTREAGSSLNISNSYQNIKSYGEVLYRFIIHHAFYHLNSIQIIKFN